MDHFKLRLKLFAGRMLDAFRKCDLLLLLLCGIATAFGFLMIASATSGYSEGSFRYMFMQILAAAAGIFFYVLISSIDTEFFSEHRMALVMINALLLAMLIPFGVTVNGNRSWLRFPFLPFNIQAAEICKISFILILASVMSSRQNSLSHPLSVGLMLDT